mmetsp:Transcript_12628/g.30585  ORF Transcript_12628/g.30585 Transcript_12628/m.30585 type:complete len:963 (+) Transcript_12628:201-3089(+)
MPLSPRRPTNKVKFDAQVFNEYEDGHMSFSSLNGGSFSSLELNLSSSSLDYSPVPSSPNQHSSAPHGSSSINSAGTTTPRKKKIGKHKAKKLPLLDLDLDCNSKHEKQFEIGGTAATTGTSPTESIGSRIVEGFQFLKSSSSLTMLTVIALMVFIGGFGTSIHLHLVTNINSDVRFHRSNIKQHSYKRIMIENSTIVSFVSLDNNVRKSGAGATSGTETVTAMEAINDTNPADIVVSSPSNIKKSVRIGNQEIRYKKDARDAARKDLLDAARIARLELRNRKKKQLRQTTKYESQNESKQDAVVNVTSKTSRSGSNTTRAPHETENKALAFIHDRRDIYKSQGLGKEWSLRGIGYLYSKHNIALEAYIPTKDQQLKQGRNVIRIVNVHPNRTDSSFSQDEQQKQDNQCELLTIWVRVMGPEIFAGRTQAVNTGLELGGKKCHWEFVFDLQESGDYTIDAKVLVWNGQAPLGGNEHSQCKFKKGSLQGQERTKLLEKYPTTTSFVGYKLHYPQKSCCEICTRTNCRYWSSPPSEIANSATIATTGCELYFDRDTDASQISIPPSRLLQNITRLFDGMGDRRPDGQIKKDGLKEAKQFHGTPHSNPTSYFLGCGWDNWFTLDYPCLSGDLDDRIYVSSGESFTFSTSSSSHLPVTSSTERRKEREAGKLPLCTLTDERLDVSRGRWVRLDSVMCQDEMEFDVRYGRNTKFDMAKFDGTSKNTVQCWNRDDLSRIGNYCGEWNCRFLNPDAKWTSALHNETNWFGVWKQYACEYLDFSDEELQSCITDRKIKSIRTEGNSIAKFMNEYLSARMEHIALYGINNEKSNTTNTSSDEAVDEGIDVVLDTLTMAALSMNPEQNYLGLNKKMEKMPKVNLSSEEHYWVTGFFLSSEREPHIQARRMEQLNRLAEIGLEQKGYKMINSFDMSAAFAYDTATQFDGLHLIGPPMKMIMKKLFHHMCGSFQL